MTAELERALEPWLYPPADYLPVYEQSELFALVAGVETLVLTYRSSLLRRTRIAMLGFLPITLAAGTLVRFEGSPAVGDLASFRPATFQPNNTHEIPIYLNLPPASEIRVYATLPAPADFQIRLAGWEYR